MRYYKLLACLILSAWIPILYACSKHKVPTVITEEVTNITGTTATSGGTITDEGSGTVVERGVCWSKGINPTILDSKTIEGGGVGTFVSNLTDLEPATTYYVKAYAKNEAGIGYGMTFSFTTLGQKASAITKMATSLTTNSAVLNATVNANYIPTNVAFEYGINENYGQTVIPQQNQITGNTDVNISLEVTGLTPGTNYHFRIKAVNSLGTSYGNDMTFTTLGQIPDAITLEACCVSATGATLRGRVNPNYLTTTVTFEYGQTVSYGNSVNAIPSTITGNSNINVTASLSDLVTGVTYHFRVKASNSIGTTYGNDLTFTPLITDIDGNKYNIVTIGNQVWLSENLKATRYNDGTSIPLITANQDWYTATDGAFCWYNNDIAYKATYGALYNWYAVKTGRICPTGWHVPSDSEWTTLINYLGGPNVAGGKLKESGFEHWKFPNTEATDESKFDALPGGFRNVYNEPGNFRDIGEYGYWWSGTAIDQDYVWYRGLYYNSGEVLRNSFSPKTGFSVRCIKN